MGQAEAHEQKAASIDLNFITILANDPRKALEYARNMDEVNQARAALKELAKVKHPKSYNRPKTIIPTLKYTLPLNPQAKNEAQQVAAERPTIDLSQDEVPANEERRVVIAAPPKPRESGFTPSSARRGRGSRGGRGTPTARG